MKHLQDSWESLKELLRKERHWILLWKPWRSQSRCSRGTQI